MSAPRKRRSHPQAIARSPIMNSRSVPQSGPMQAGAGHPSGMMVDTGSRHSMFASRMATSTPHSVHSNIPPHHINGSASPAMVMNASFRSHGMDVKGRTSREGRGNPYVLVHHLSCMYLLLVEVLIVLLSCIHIETPTFASL